MTDNLDARTIAELFRTGVLRADDPIGREDELRGTALWKRTQWEIVWRDFQADIAREFRAFVKTLGTWTRGMW